MMFQKPRMVPVALALTAVAIGGVVKATAVAERPKAATAPAPQREGVLAPSVASAVPDDAAPPASEPGAPAGAAVVPPAADAFGRTPASVSAQTAPPRPAAATGTGTWALVVGINDYPGANHDLRFAVNDADDAERALERFGVPSSQRLVLRDGAATGEAVLAGIAWLTRNAGPDAVAVVFVAGHARQASRGRQTFVAADGRELRDVVLARRLASLQAKATWLNFATCFAGGFDELLAPGRTLIAAAPAGQLAYENTAIGRSYLGEYLIRRGLLSGDDDDVRAAFVTAEAAIRRDHPNRVPVELVGPRAGAVRLRHPAPQIEPGPTLPSEATTGAAETPAPKPQPPTEPEPAQEPSPARLIDMPAKPGGHRRATS